MEIAQNLRHEDRERIIGGIGLALVLTVLGLGLAGILGSGPLSNVVASTPSGHFRVKYHRFERQQAPVRLQVFLDHPGQRIETSRLWINRSYLERMKIKSIMPEPDGIEAGADGIIFSFRVHPLEPKLLVAFQLEPDDFGQIFAHLISDQGEHLQFKHFIYP